MPLQAPINYGIGDVPDPNDALRKQLEFATGLVGAQQKNQIFAAQMQQAQQAQQQEQDLRANLAAVAANPTPEAIARVSILHPSLAKDSKTIFDMLEAKDQKAQFSLAQQMHAALLQNQPDIAKKIALDAATANENSGNATRAAQLRQVAAGIDGNPTHANIAVGSFLAHAMGPEKYVETFGKFNALAPEQQKLEAGASEAQSKAITAGNEAKYSEQQQVAKLTETRTNTANTADQIKDRANQLELKRQEVASTLANVRSQIEDRGATLDLKKREANLKEMEFGLKTKVDEANIEKVKREALDMPAGAEKIVETAADAVQAARVSAAKVGDLAGFFEKQGTGMASSGASLRALESLKSAWGGEDEYTKRLQQYTQIANSETLRELAHVRMTQEEVHLIQSGFPAATASPKIVAQFLRATEKAALMEAEYNRAKIQWVSENRTLGTAKRDFKIDGRPVKVGDTFNDFALPPPKADEKSAPEPSWIARYK